MHLHFTLVLHISCTGVIWQCCCCCSLALQISPGSSSCPDPGRRWLLLTAGYTDGDLVLTLCIAWEVGLLRTGSDVWSAVRISPAQAASGGQHCNFCLTYLLYAVG